MLWQGYLQLNLFTHFYGHTQIFLVLTQVILVTTHEITYTPCLSSSCISLPFIPPSIPPVCGEEYLCYKVTTLDPETPYSLLVVAANNATDDPSTISNITLLGGRFLAFVVGTDKAATESEGKLLLLICILQNTVKVNPFCEL